MVARYPLLLFFCLIVDSGCLHRDFLSGIIESAPTGGDESFDVVLLQLSGEKVVLEGEPAEELARVPNAMVRVEGRILKIADKHTMRVQSYQIVDSGEGVIPHVGILHWDVGRLLLMEVNGGSVIELVGPLVAELRVNVGAKVWIVGPIIDLEMLEVFDFGILRPDE